MQIIGSDTISLKKCAASLVIPYLPVLFLQGFVWIQVTKYMQLLPLGVPQYKDP